MKVPLPVPVPAPALVLKRSNNSASIHSQIEALTLDSECSDQEGNGRDSGSEYGLEETEEEQQEQQEGEEAEEEEEEEGDESEESVPQHPLNNEWTMWYVEPDRAKTWEQTLHQITSFKTVENFWSLYYHIKTPSQIKIGSDYCMFKAGVRPMWEDEANVKGGRWIVSFPKSATGDLNFYWEYSLLSLIGEFCEHSPDLCGAVVNIRQKADKIALWTADGSNEEGILEIGRQLRDGLHPGAGYALQYQLHSDSMVQQGSVFRSIYTL
ncbi:LOW QUALITY PROTEIN: eukaryotic translation initiation factor 4E1 [Drosophila obscura]|uniref:LOW QUALITY PROTEIN: eukaryotic translation initiation factor 4E1 n=1 Tax=Drosophila obscura TaxID=7282 RepID=UPI001BB25CE4|nr:LOW QUALITY PROTEIN: eukaryotic translation initiation factor 4E1 [Drosophila obscura]